MTTTEQSTAVLAVPELLMKLAEFCDLNSDHIIQTDLVGARLNGQAQLEVHMKGNGNAARGVVFALDSLDNVLIQIAQHDETRQVYVNGVFDGAPVSVFSCSDEFDASVIDTYVDWKDADWLGYITVTPEVLRAMAEHAS